MNKGGNKKILDDLMKFLNMIIFNVKQVIKCIIDNNSSPKGKKDSSCGNYFKQ